MKKQTLVQAVHLALSRKSRPLARAAHALDGVWQGADGETQQQERAVADDLPRRSERLYSMGQWVDAVYLVDDADRYRTRTYDDAMREAARIEARTAEVAS